MPRASAGAVTQTPPRGAKRAAARTAYYVTTAIDYANGPPHLGHALEKIQADCLARYRRIGRARVHFVIGLDEHGQTVAQTAHDAGAAPQAWVDAIAADYKQAMARLAVSYDDFIRTTEARHARAVRELLRRIRRRHPEDVYEAAHAGSYCRGCETYKRSEDLVDGRCAAHPTIDVEWVDERIHLFRLSAYAGRLRAHYAAHPDFVVPPATFEEVRGFVAGELRDVAISSSVSWGIPFPDAPGLTFHVWFDALVNYLSATGFPAQRHKLLWPPALQLVGPDITRFHAVVWPAMLIAAGIEPPRQIWAHGWLLTDGARFSKTAGVPVTLEAAAERHGSDALRFYLLTVMPWGGDGDFSLEQFDAVYGEVLAGGLGKLVSRALELIVRHCGGRIPPGAATELDRSHRSLLEQYRGAMDGLRLRDGAGQLELLGQVTMRYLDERERATAAAGPAELDETVAAVHRALVRIAAVMQPFMPAGGEALYGVLGGRGSVAELSWEEISEPVTGGWRVVPGDPLFPEGAPT